MVKYDLFNSLLYAVKAQTSLAPLSRFCGSHITTAHEQQCCRFQSYAKAVPSPMKLTSKIDKAWTTFLGSTTTDHLITACDVWLKQRIDLDCNVWLTYLQLSSKSVYKYIWFQQTKKLKETVSSCLLLLIWKVLHLKTFTGFFLCQKSPAEEKKSRKSEVLANVSHYL